MVLLLFCVASYVFSAPTPATIVVGNPETGSPSEPEQAVIAGGNVTEANISTIAITSRWAGFYGVIQAGINLSDAAGNTFYQWTVTNVTDAVVYAANSSISVWTLEPIDQSRLPSWLTAGANDNFTRTFTSTEAFSSATISPIPNTPYTTTWQAGSQGSLKTYALMQTGTYTNVWAGKAIWNTSSFKGAAVKVDYQILVPANSAGVTYYFYFELP